jgi:hypothetical protein
MKLTRLGDLAQATEADAGSQSELEAQIKDLVHRDSIRKSRRDPEHDAAADATLLIERISAASMAAIDQAIGELQNMRAQLLDHNEKVRRELRALEFANEEAAGSLKAVSGILKQWRQDSPATDPELSQQGLHG